MNLNLKNESARAALAAFDESLLQREEDAEANREFIREVICDLIGAVGMFGLYAAVCLLMACVK